MKIERLRKSHKKKIIIGALLICAIGGALTFATTRAKYRLTQSIKLVEGTVNYKPYDFKIMAMYKSEDGTNYTEINTMPSSGYVINEEKTYCTTDNKTKVKGKIKTVSGIHGLYNIAKSDKCYLYFDAKPITIDDIITVNSPKTTTPTFSNAATTDEGVYAVSDGMYGGTSYYWRGAVTNNYVKFANFCWRIVRINGDKSIRLIYDGTVCHANGTSTTNSIAISKAAYNLDDNDQSNYVGWTYSGTSQRPNSTVSGTASNAKAQLERWYSSNITGANVSKVVQGKYCNDRNAQSGNAWAINGNAFYYAAYKRIITDQQPTLSCPSVDVYVLNIGLITADEVMYAGGLNAGNKTYYLYNGQYYWTMSPSAWDINASVFNVHSSGDLMYDGHAVGVAGESFGLRPVINLKADTTFKSGGTGEANSPYIVE